MKFVNDIKINMGEDKNIIPYNSFHQNNISSELIKNQMKEIKVDYRLVNINSIKKPGLLKNDESVHSNQKIHHNQEKLRQIVKGLISRFLNSRKKSMPEYSLKNDGLLIFTKIKMHEIKVNFISILNFSMIKKATTFSNIIALSVAFIFHVL